MRDTKIGHGKGTNMRKERSVSLCNHSDRSTCIDRRIMSTLAHSVKSGAALLWYMAAHRSSSYRCFRSLLGMRSDSLSGLEGLARLFWLSKSIVRPQGHIDYE